MSKTLKHFMKMDQSKDVIYEFDENGNISYERYPDSQAYVEYQRIKISEDKEIVLSLFYEDSITPQLMSICIINKNESLETEISINEDNLPNCIFSRLFDSNDSLLEERHYSSPVYQGVTKYIYDENNETVDVEHH